MIKVVLKPEDGYLRGVFTLRNEVLTLQSAEGQHPPERTLELDSWIIEWETPIWIKVLFIEGVETEVLRMEMQRLECRKLPTSFFQLKVDGRLIAYLGEVNTPSITFKTFR